MQLNPIALKNGAITMAYYLCYALAVWGGGLAVPSGPCTPGLGDLLLIFAPVPSGVLFLKNLYRYIHRKQEVLISALIHGAALVCYFTLMGKFL